ncbi:MAG: IS1595 family transposase, partial [Fluviicola sp.]
MRLLEFYTSFPTEESCKKDFKLMREKVGITCKVCGGCAHYWLKSKEM